MIARKETSESQREITEELKRGIKWLPKVDDGKNIRNSTDNDFTCIIETYAKKKLSFLYFHGNE